jgi:PPOX class probable FMN-dependent enzyme
VTVSRDWTEITTEAELRELVGAPLPRVRDKGRSVLHEVDRAWIAAAPLCLLGTSDAQGGCDVSPRGDPGGVAHVLDERTLVIPERPGNRRADSLRNVLANPRVGLLFIIPGRGDTLRVTGRAKIVRDAPLLADLTVEGHRPELALVVEVSELFYHCPKAFLRSALWDPASWRPAAAPRRAVIAKAVERQDEDLAELDRYYGPSYAERLYG